MAENPYESSDQPHGEAPRPAIPLWGRLLLYAAIIVGLGALLLPATRSARGPALRNQCLSNMKQIMLALHKYNDEHGELPPAYTVDEDGNRLHSWRALILPYMEGQSQIAELIDYSKSWDDPANEEARKSVVDAYLCPGAAMDGDETTYVAVVGPEFLFSGSTPRTYDEVADGDSRTIAIIEVSLKHAVPWMSPTDIDEETLLETDRALSSGHSGVVVAGYLDGHANGIDTEIDRETLRGMLTIAGRETTGEDE